MLQPIQSSGGRSGSNSVRAEIDDAVATSSKKHGVPAALIRAVIKQESSGNPNAVSSRGAQGLMQLMPNTARELGVTNAFNIRQNIDGGTKYLAMLIKRYHGDLALALAANNAGPRKVLKYGGIPPYKQTQRYVRRVMADFNGQTAIAPTRMRSNVYDAPLSRPSVTVTAGLSAADVRAHFSSRALINSGLELNWLPSADAGSRSLALPEIVNWR